MSNLKHTPAPWYSIEFAGMYALADEPFYEGNNLLDCEQCDRAKENGTLAAAAPELLEALQKLNEAIDAYWNGGRTDKLAKAVTFWQNESHHIILKATVNS